MAKFTQQPKRNDKKIAGMYDLEERLGAGHFAEVKLAKHVFTGERVAVKVIDKLKLDETAKNHLYQEVRCMKLVQHPNIVRLFEVIDTNTKLYLVQELGDGGDMYDYIMKHEQGFDESKARRYFRQMLQAIHYCHKLFVVHRDLKPENVIFFKKFDVAKLTDFGFSNKFMPGKKLQTACGSLAYSAPEILLGDSYDAPAVDVWSLGVILYMMVVGKPPFREANESETLTMILDCKFHIPEHLSPACRSLISRMIVRDVKKRAELDDIMEDPWTTEEQGPLMCSTIALANQIKLGQDQHNEIIQKMLLGDIADKETIKKCLEAGSYNHISATYYLLAEQVLRKLRWQNMPKQDNNNGCSPIRPNGMSPVNNQKLPSPQSPGQDVQLLLHSPTTSQNSNLLMVADKTNEESLSDDSTFADDADISETHFRTNRVRYHSTESMHGHVAANEGDEPVSVSLKVRKKANPRLLKKRRVVNVKSTPAFLNQISEERESDLDDSPHHTPRLRRISRRSLDIVKSSKKPARRSSGDRRSSSMSSSSEDDTDLDKKMRRLSTERCRRSPKRRSDDEGEGEDEFAGADGSSGVARKKKMSESLPATIQEAYDKLRLSTNMMEAQFKLSQLSETHATAIEDGLLPGKDGAPIRKISCGSVEGNLNGRESLTWSVKETAAGEKEGGENIDNDVLRHILTSDDETSRANLIRIGIKENGQVNYGLSADIISETRESVSDGSIPSNAQANVGVIVEDMQHVVTIGDTQSNPGFSELLMDNREAKAVKVRDRIALWNAKSHEVQCTNRGTTTPGSFEDFLPPVNRTNPDQPVRNERLTPEASGIIEVLRGSQCTEQDDDRTLVDITDSNVTGATAAKFPFGGSDIDEIQMYMKAKEGGIELQSVGVRTIYNNSKVTRVTSNCCRII